jgi:hypothetical protein
MKCQCKCGQQKKRQDQDREPCPVFVKAVCKTTHRNIIRKVNRVGLNYEIYAA